MTRTTNPLDVPFADGPCPECDAVTPRHCCTTPYLREVEGWRGECEACGELACICPPDACPDCDSRSCACFCEGRAEPLPSRGMALPELACETTLVRCPGALPEVIRNDARTIALHLGLRSYGALVIAPGAAPHSSIARYRKIGG